MRIRKRPWFILAAALLCGCAARSAPVSHWQLRSPLPTGYDLYDVTFGNGKFVALGFGPVITSTNGVNWDIQSDTGPMYDAAFGNGVFVGTRLNGSADVSPDGIHWANVRLPNSISIEGIGFCNGAFICGGSSNMSSTFGMLSSRDGTNWAQIASLPGNVTKVIYGGGRYVATGYSGNVYVSNDATNWSVRNVGSSIGLTGVAYGNGLYAAVSSAGGAYVSPDTVSWANTGTAVGNMSRIIFVNGKFIAVGRASTAAVSADGTNWVNMPLGVNVNYGGTAYGNGVYVTVGTSGQVWTSLDATNWISRFEGATQDLYGTAYASNQWVVVGDLEETITSTNGIDWVYRRGNSLGTLQGVAWASGLSVAANAYSGLGELWVSSNMSTWIDYYPQPGPALYAVAHGGNTWLAVGAAGAFWRSTDGTDWSVGTIGATDLLGVTYAQGKFVVVGDQGVTMSTPDGITWTTNNSTTTAHLNGVAYGQGVFLAVGVSGTMVASADGVHWSPHSLNTTETFTSIAYGEGYFVTTGIDGAILTSPDTLTWAVTGVQTTPPNLALYSVAYGDHNFLAVGEGGVIVQSDPFIDLSISKTNPATMSITGPAGRVVEVQTRSSLDATLPWSTIATVSITNQPTLWTDTQAAGSSRFYRLSLVQ